MIPFIQPEAQNVVQNEEEEEEEEEEGVMREL